MQDLVSELNAALAAVQSALDAANAAPAAEDPAWTAVKNDLTANGWTAPLAPAPEPTIIPVIDANESPAEDAAEST